MCYPDWATALKSPCLYSFYMFVQLSLFCNLCMFLPSWKLFSHRFVKKTHSHLIKLDKKQFKLHKSFFTVKTIRMWNSLPLRYGDMGNDSDLHTYIYTHFHTQVELDGMMSLSMSGQLCLRAKQYVCFPSLLHTFAFFVLQATLFCWQERGKEVLRKVRVALVGAYTGQKYLSAPQCDSAKPITKSQYCLWHKE